MIAAIEAALQHDVAGDPITGIRWTRRTTEKIATELATLDIQVCPRTVARMSLLPAAVCSTIRARNTSA